MTNDQDFDSTVGGILMKPFNEHIQFRLFHMPCCNALICWVNPRLPNNCPECGERVFLLLKTKPELTLVSDTEAWIRYVSRGQA